LNGHGLRLGASAAANVPISVGGPPQLRGVHGNPVDLVAGAVARLLHDGTRERGGSRDGQLLVKRPHHSARLAADRDCTPQCVQLGHHSFTAGCSEGGADQALGAVIEWVGAIWLGPLRDSQPALDNTGNAKRVAAVVHERWRAIRAAAGPVPGEGRRWIRLPPHRPRRHWRIPCFRGRSGRGPVCHDAERGLGRIYSLKSDMRIAAIRHGSRRQGGGCCC
jgi:hypothetical protein